MEVFFQVHKLELDWSQWCWRVWMGWKNGCNAFVWVSLHLESRKALVSSMAPYAFNSFFFLEQETVRHSRYMIWLIFM